MYRQMNRQQPDWYWNHHSKSERRQHSHNLKKTKVNNLVPATSSTLFDNFEKFCKLPWTKTSNVSIHLNQSLGFFSKFCEEAEARFGIKYSPEGQRVILMSMFYCKLPTRAMKAEISKAFTADKTITDFIVELTENLSLVEPSNLRENIEKGQFAIEPYRGYEPRNIRDQDSRERFRRINYYPKEDKWQYNDIHRREFDRNWRETPRKYENQGVESWRGRNSNRGQQRRAGGRYDKRESREDRFVVPREKQKGISNYREPIRKEGQTSRMETNRNGYAVRREGSGARFYERGSPSRSILETNKYKVNRVADTPLHMVKYIEEVEEEPTDEEEYGEEYYDEYESEYEDEEENEGTEE
ncbi:UNVERIFIED_CONTAM: hypothetical protein RMT77_019807 [Armadillidium vulgare]